MKRLCILFCTVFTLLLLTACGEEQTAQFVVQPAALSEETTQMLELIAGDEEIVFFDYTTDGSAASYDIDLWAIQDGAWQNHGGIVGNLEGRESGRFGIRLLDDSYQIFAIDESGHSIYTSEDPVDFSAEGMMVGTGRLSDSTEIMLDEEIVLLVKLGTDKNSLAIGPLEKFRDADCSAGLAITLTFSGEGLE